METDSFETDLRQALARGAAGVPDEAVERLRHRDYRPRTRRRGSMAAAGTAGVLVAAAAVTVAVLPAGRHPAGPAAGPRASGTSRGGSGSTPATAPIQLTAKQTLLSLSAAAAAAPRPSGRYAVQAEKTYTTNVYPPAKTGLKHNLVMTENGKETNVVDTVNGSAITYDQITSTSGSAPGPGWTPPTKAPTQANSGPGSSQTSAQLDALSTDPAKLRAELLKMGDEQGRLPPQTDADVVYEQAASLLWDANLSAAVRACVYKVLAATPGVEVNASATDSSGRAAVEISYFEAWAKQRIETFENPVTGATLESAWVFLTGDYAEDLYLSITYTNAIPANPYKG
jgi:hypothetical protein